MKYKVKFLCDVLGVPVHGGRERTFTEGEESWIDETSWESLHWRRRFDLTPWIVLLDEDDGYDGL